MVAHEVKDPLATAEGWLNLVLTGAAKVDRDEERRMLERAMVNELLSLTTIETGRFQFHRTPQDPAAVAAEVVAVLREKAAEKRVTLMVEGGTGAAAAGSPAVLEVHARGRLGSREHGPRRDVRDDRRPRYGPRAFGRGP
ncbi:MAG: hypothetical protein NTU62_00785 [Spirochaetes bacterium]|nr:hypothetical protein [Spirochaetota bacterium]